MEDKIFAVILTGGKSSRMGGGIKSLNKFNNKTIFERVFNNIENQVKTIVINSNQKDDWEQLVAIYKMNLSNYLETPIEIKKNRNGKGKIIVHYHSENDLADIIKNKILK